MKVYVGVPTRGKVNPAILSQIGIFAELLGTTARWMPGHLSAGANRTRLVGEFLATDAEVMVMVDDDVVPGQGADLLVERIEQGWDIMAAAVPIFAPSMFPLPFIAAFRREPGGYAMVPPRPGIAECDAVGTGLIAISRNVLETIEKPFREEVRDGLVMSDDAVFCEQAKEAGFRIGIDFRVTCDHHAEVSLGALMRGLAHAAKPENGSPSGIVLPTSGRK